MVVLSKDKEGVAIINAFQIVLNESGLKLSQIWADKGNVFNIQWNKTCCGWKVYKNCKEQNLQMNDFNIKNVYIDKSDDIVNEYIYNFSWQHKT